MQIVRYAQGESVRVGVNTDGGVTTHGGHTDGRVTTHGGTTDGATTHRLPVESLAELLRLPLTEMRSMVEAAVSRGEAETGQLRLLPPIDGLTEVWAAGVTYQRSSEARQQESVVADVYSRVYDADRPELFFKSLAWRVSGHGEPIGIRVDSPINVAEPELALVINSAGEVVGLGVCNDVSSRSIEGENPLYLPQAKVYSGACAFGPSIRPIWEISDANALAISLVVRRGSQISWKGVTSTALLHRRFDDLIEHLRRNLVFPDGAILSTGTGVVPELTFTLEPGDTVEIDIEQVGTLVNEVRSATEANFGWLTPAPARAPR